MFGYNPPKIIGKVLYKVLGSDNDRALQALEPTVDRINQLEGAMEKRSEYALKQLTSYFRDQLEEGKSLDDLLPEAFAAVREASKRTLGKRHYDVQLMGGILLHQGKIAEMATGEGKTLTSTLAAYLNALKGDGVHIVTVNDYLAQRDRDWNAPLFELLGLTVGALQSDMDGSDRKAEYKCDITYGTSNEFGFDYLRDNMKMSLREQCQRGHPFAIIDEIDSIMIDEARTPWIISGSAAESYTEDIRLAEKIVQRLRVGRDFTVMKKEGQCLLTEEGVEQVEQLLDVSSIYSGEHTIWPHLITTALRAEHLYKRDKDYLKEDGKIVIIDESTGRKMKGRRWSEGLHEAIEAKEYVEIQENRNTLASVTCQNYFKLYDKMAGMTGTAYTEAIEFYKVLGKEVAVVPTNLPMIREDLEDRIFATFPEKKNEILEEISRMHAQGRPVLIGTRSIAKSEEFSEMLQRRGIQHKVLNAKYHKEEAKIIAQAGQRGAVTIATNMAGRGTDIELGPGVNELGGLHVIGTERHEYCRVDNQLRGRAGRQGDRGSSRFFLSLDDELFTKNAPPKLIARLQQSINICDGYVNLIAGGIINYVLKSIETMHTEQRKSLLEYDKVIDAQRKIVYKTRQQVLKGDDRKGMVKSWLYDRVERAIDRFLPRRKVKKWDHEGLNQFMQTKFDIDISDEVTMVRKEQDIKEFEDSLKARVEKSYDERERTVGEENMGNIESHLILNAIDTHWKDHLYAMDQLRESTGLLAFGGKDPKTEYICIGFDYFDQMLERIMEEVTDLIFEVEVQRLNWEDILGIGFD